MRTNRRQQPCFVVTGEALADIARNLVLEDEPGKAWRLLADGLVGEGADQVVCDVLVGKSDLTGDSNVGIGVESADTDKVNDYIEAMLRQYVGRVKLKRRWYRPCAVVTRFGPEDARAASKDFAIPLYSEKSAMSKWSLRRAEFYAGPDEIVRVVRCEIDGRQDGFPVVFEPCSEPPHWLSPAPTAQAAVDAWLAAGRELDQRGAEASGLDQSILVHPSVETHKPIDDAEQLRQEELRHQEEHRQIGEKVREQAGDNLLPLTLVDGRVVQVPRAPFTIWALSRVPELRATLPEWMPVSTSGLKLYNDSVYHTDWVLGAGLTIAESYEDNVNQAAWALAFDMQVNAVDAVDEKP